MYRKISSRIQRPSWACDGTRFAKLDNYDRLLDGTFYDHLPACFYDETAGTHKVPIEDKRPSAQFRLPRMVARWSARKLWGGRHRPVITHPDIQAKKRIKAMMTRAKVYQTMMDATIRGSVGSIAITFRVDATRSSETPDIALRIWRAKLCMPFFDDMGELACLRVHYLTTASAWQVMASDEKPIPELDGAQKYWFIRDYLPTDEVTYEPIREVDYDPNYGCRTDNKPMVEWDIINHNLGFVPGGWIKNLAGGEDPDGACTWEDAIPVSIELDYLLSQTARGTRYNCSPQPVIKGEIINADGEITRGPTHYIHLAPDLKNEDGETLGGADAKLLEMSGSGVDAAIKLIDKLHDFGLEQIAAPRKDPEKMKGAMSGTALERMDEDSHDLVHELRSSYGDDGLLPLLRKMIVAAMPDVDPAPLALQWPRLQTPSPADIATLVGALSEAINPLGVTYTPKPGAIETDGKDGQPKGKVQPEGNGESQEPPQDYMFVTPKEARLIVQSTLDIQMMDAEGDDEQDMQVGGGLSLDEAAGSAPKPLDPEDDPEFDPTQEHQGSILPPVRVE